MIDIIDFKYDDADIISDSIINFYQSLADKRILGSFINLYISDKGFFNFVQKNFLINKMSSSYLVRLYNDYEKDDLVDFYDVIERVNTTRWI